jgi:hypothetical protein
VDQTLLNEIIASAGAGTAIIVILFLTGFAWPKHSVDEIKRERDQAIARAERAEEQRDDALRLTTDRTVPLLEHFVGATNTLIPILQGLVRYGAPVPFPDLERGHVDERRGRLHHPGDSRHGSSDNP